MVKVFPILSAILLLSQLTSAKLIKISAAGNVHTSFHSAIPEGTAVEYTFLFNTEMDGYSSYAGVPTPLKDVPSSDDAPGTDYFYADFQGDFMLQDHISDNSSYNYGFYIGEWYDVSRLYGGSQYHYVYLEFYKNIATCVVGDGIEGMETSYKETIMSDLRVTSISAVPEPAVTALILSGVCLLGVGAFQSMKRKNKYKI